MALQDSGITLEIMGFVLLLLTSNRLDWRTPRYNEFQPDHGEIIVIPKSNFDRFREKIIPFRYVNLIFIIGIGYVVTGLMLQYSNFN